MKRRHYLTVVKRDCCCNVCGRSLRIARADDVVYRHEPRELLCLSCADDRGVEYRTSRPTTTDHLSRIEETMNHNDHNDDHGRDADRFKLLDRLAERMPDLDRNQHEIEWMTLPDGAEALLVDGGGIDGGNGVYFANAGDDVHAVGSMQPTAPAIGCVVLHPDGSRRLADVRPDPLADQGDAGDE